MSWWSAFWAFVLGLLRALDARAGRAEDRAAAAEGKAEAERDARAHERDAVTEVTAGDSLPDRTVVERLRDGGF